jgi:hypothetical protein
MTKEFLLLPFAALNQRFPIFSGGGFDGFSGFGSQTNNQAEQAIAQGNFFPGGINQALQAGKTPCMWIVEGGTTCAIPYLRAQLLFKSMLSASRQTLKRTHL